MNPWAALFYSFFFGLLHGILPDEHTWPITLSYAIGGASGRKGLKAGLYFSAAFTFQRTILSELAYLALSPVLLRPAVNGVVYIAVGIAMSVAGSIVLRRNEYPHVHLIRRRSHWAPDSHRPVVSVLPARWALIHGFLAGFGFGAFSLFVNTVAAPAMPNIWTGFLPGLIFGLGTTIMVALLGALFGSGLRRLFGSLSQEKISRMGALTGARTLFLGGLLFVAFGIAVLSGFDRKLSLSENYILISIFIFLITIPCLLYTVIEVRRSG